MASPQVYAILRIDYIHNFVMIFIKINQIKSFINLLIIGRYDIVRFNLSIIKEEVVIW